jgi:hypothetical protein
MAYRGLAGVGAACLPAALPAAAQAHVKWFAPYDVPAAPVGLEHVFGPTFVELCVLAVLLFFLASSFERTAVGQIVLRAVDRVFADLRERTESLMRAGVGAFFVGACMTGGIILTPELKTASVATPLLQAAIAAGVFWRSTMVFSGVGIIILFVQGLWDYGMFHMMDYPIFLGAAAYLILRGMGRDHVFHLRAVDVLRWGAAITLMWASVEKWAYPEWSYPVLRSHAVLTVGLDPKFYMIAAGVVEFSLAFGMLWTPLVRRLSAIVLISMFVSAIFEFGKIDALGHLLIIVILLVIAADDQSPRALRAVLAPLWYSGALASTILAYYLTHSLLFGTAIL